MRIHRRYHRHSRLILPSLVVRELLQSTRPRSGVKDRGLSLIELLVALIISLVLIHAMAHIMVSEVQLTQSFDEHSNIKDATICLLYTSPSPRDS